MLRTDDPADEVREIELLLADRIAAGASRDRRNESDLVAVTDCGIAPHERAPLDAEAVPLSAPARAALGPELAVTGALAAERPVADEHSNHFAAFLVSAVALPQARAEDFFFPRAVLRPEALAFDPQWPLASYRALRSIFPSAQTHRGERQARPNEPCPCGSGLKLKRCCGRG